MSSTQQLSLLDALWTMHKPDPPPEEVVLNALPPGELLLLAVWDLAASSAMPKGSIRIDGGDAAIISGPFGDSIARVSLSRDPAQDPIFTYGAQNMSLVGSVAVPLEVSTTDHDFLTLLRCAWYIKFRMDDILHLRQDARRAQVASYARWLNMPPERLLRFAQWFPSVEAEAMAHAQGTAS